jgi:hypothetical protein
MGMLLLLVFVSFVYASQIVFELDDAYVTPESFAQQHRLTFEKRIFGRFYLFTSPSSQHTRNVLAKRDAEGVLWGEEQVAVKRYKRDAAAPPSSPPEGGPCGGWGCIAEGAHTTRFARGIGNSQSGCGARAALRGADRAGCVGIHKKKAINTKNGEGRFN